MTPKLVSSIRAATNADGGAMVCKGHVLLDKSNGWTFIDNHTAVHLTKHDIDIFTEAANGLRHPRFPHLKASSKGLYSLHASK